jgi:hypothetical protein
MWGVSSFVDIKRDGFHFIKWLFVVLASLAPLVLGLLSLPDGLFILLWCSMVVVIGSVRMVSMLSGKHN